MSIVSFKMISVHRSVDGSFKTFSSDTIRRYRLAKEKGMLTFLCYLFIYLSTFTAMSSIQCVGFPFSWQKDVIRADRSEWKINWLAAHNLKMICKCRRVRLTYATVHSDRSPNNERHFKKHSKISLMTLLGLMRVFASGWVYRSRRGEGLEGTIICELGMVG